MTWLLQVVERNGVVGKFRWREGIMTSKQRIVLQVVGCLFFMALVPGVGSARGNDGFQQWLQSFYKRAARAGISRRTFDTTFAGVTSPNPDVLRKAAYQPEFTTEIWDYLDNRITPHAIAKGRVMGGLYQKTLAAINQRFGVKPPIILAIWSMETNYGAILLRSSRLHYVPRALATLAYGDKRRRSFAEKQLLAVLKIIQSGQIPARKMTGSWAGAMGHTQFIPTSYLAYGVDMDGDGRRDIWSSVPDALATAANLLHKNGWQPGRPWGREVVVPAGGGTYIGKTKTLGQWRQLGFSRPGGQGFADPAIRAELKMPAGPSGPGFLVMHNFFVIKHYNNSDFYALAVGLLADRLAGKKGMAQHWPRPADSLDRSEKIVLQKLLKKQGYYTGKIDGMLGNNTRKAIRAFQQKNGIRADGKPTKALLKALRR